MEQQSFHPLDYMAAVKRRKWWFVVPLAACVALGGAILLVWPKTYLSRVALGVQSPSVSGDLLRGVSSMDPVDRQRAIQQQLLSPEVLDRVIGEEQIDPKHNREQVAARLRDDLAKNIEVPPTIGLNGRPDPTRGIEMFYLGVTDASAERAQRIANRVAQVFVDENLKAQRARAENSADVLAQQAGESQARLTDLDNRMRTKKQGFIGRLPEQIPANVQMVNGARQQFESVSIQIRAQQDGLTLIDGQIQAMQQGAGVEGMTASALAASQAAQKHVDDLQAQLASDRALGYTDKHPDVTRLQEEIKVAKADVAASKVDQPSNRDELLKSDPLYRQKVQERDMARIHLKELQDAARNASAQISSYQSRVESAPMVEQELTSLQRDYDLEKARYADLNTRLQAARLAEDLAKKQGGERFSILYPADYPKQPIDPQPLKVMGLALALGFVLGAGAALGREFLDRSVYDSRALQNEFEVPVLGEIPRITAA
ncbi:MAG TPA: GNVR domain-containing protein [Vicinamibacterales bacterium]|jgi:polysaccharide chain length determinant protein (PEP-CTERM system associated)